MRRCSRMTAGAWLLLLLTTFNAPAADTPVPASSLVVVQVSGVPVLKDRVTKFLDVRASRRFRVGPASLEGSVDLFNLLNENHVLGQNEALGSTWGRPNRILTPRIIRFGITARF